MLFNTQAQREKHKSNGDTDRERETLWIRFGILQTRLIPDLLVYIQVADAKIVGQRESKSLGERKRHTHTEREKTERKKEKKTERGSVSRQVQFNSGRFISEHQGERTYTERQ